MKPLQLASLACAIFALAHPAAAEWFVRPSALYVSYQNSGYGNANKTGLSIAAGAAFGACDQHELSIEVASMNWALRKYGYATTPDFFLTTGSGQYDAYLVHYRFRFGSKDARWRAYLGPSLGWANVRGGLTQFRSGVIAHDDLGRWPAAYGGAAGVTLKLTNFTEIDLGYRFLRIAAPNSSRTHIRTVAVRANLFQAGLGFRF